MWTEIVLASWVNHALRMSGTDRSAGVTSFLSSPGPVWLFTKLASPAGSLIWTIFGTLVGDSPAAGLAANPDPTTEMANVVTTARRLTALNQPTECFINDLLCFPSSFRFPISRPATVAGQPAPPA